MSVEKTALRTPNRSSATRAASRTAATRRHPRGQATVEYTLVTHAMLFLGTAAIMPVMGKLFEAFSTFYASIFFVLNSAAI